MWVLCPWAGGAAAADGQPVLRQVVRERLRHRGRGLHAVDCQGPMSGSTEGKRVMKHQKMMLKTTRTSCA